jgi:predicted TIM-barrel fold metal-dependent hydrolase
MGLLASRFGVAIGKKAFNLVDDLRKGRLEGNWQDHIRQLSFHPMEALRALTDRQDRDNLLFVVDHLRHFISFLEIGTLEIPEILARMKAGAPGIDIWVPLMMDMSYAYPGSRPDVRFERQRALVTELTAQAGGRIMPFYAFDPRRARPDPTEEVNRAMEDQGFVGIKLYPPLGYMPIGNADRNVERALEGLYAYCCRNEEHPIPITVHCSWSAGVYSNEYAAGVSNIRSHYRQMAHPSHWARVLKRFPGLKVNLAHFGGLGEWEARAKGEIPEENWVDPILDLMKRYDHVYTDLSFHGLPATGLAEDYRRVLLEKIRGVEHKVLLGSDWYMSRMQCRLEDYWEGFKALLPEHFDQMCSSNAVSFLRSEATERFFPRFFESGGGRLGRSFRDLFA